LELFRRLILDNNYYYKNSKTIVIERQIAEKLKLQKNLQETKKIFDILPDYVKGYCYIAWNQFKINKNDSKQVEYLKALYDEQIYNLDKKLGELFKLMDDPKLSKNTILIITADHGEEFMEHGNLGHGLNLFSTLTKVPLIIHIPGVEPKKIKEMVQGIDIYPTALSLTGLKPESKIEGIDLTGMIKGNKNAVKNKYLSSEYKGVSGIQLQNWRFYYWAKKGIGMSLYNLDTDPLEQRDVLPQNAKKVNEIIKLINSSPAFFQ